MPIKARVDMLTTGIRTPIGMKVFGKDLREIASIGEALEGVLKKVPSGITQALLVMISVPLAAMALCGSCGE